jgi:GxxExxY protein
MVSMFSTEDGLVSLENKIREAAKTVQKSIGPGFSKEIYEKELSIEFSKCELKYLANPVIKVKYEKFQLKGKRVSFIIESRVILEVIVSKRKAEQFVKKMMNNLKISGRKYGIIVNFGRKNTEIVKVAN